MKMQADLNGVIENLTGVPCIVCGNIAYSLGVALPEDQSKVKAPEGKSRLMFFNLCYKCTQNKAASTEKAVHIMQQELQAKGVKNDKSCC